MPPGARIVGLMVVLVGSVCPAAEGPLTGGNAPPPAETHDRPAGQMFSEQASRRLHAAMGSRAGDVEAVDFESPLAPTTTTSPVGWESPDPSTHRGGNQPQAGEPASGSSALLESVSPDGGPRIPLVTQERSNEAAGARTPGRPNGLSPLITVSGSLGVVLGLFLLVAWMMQRAVPGGSVLLPKEVVEVLGRATLAGRGQVHLLRCGSKLLLVCVSPTGIETLTEITDPDEVNRLAGLCGQGRPGSTTAAFRQVFQQFAQERSVPEMPGASDDVRLANAGISRRPGRVLEDHDV